MSLYNILILSSFCSVLTSTQSQKTLVTGDESCFDCKRICLDEGDCSDTNFECSAGTCSLLCGSEGSCNNLDIEIKPTAGLNIKCLKNTFSIQTTMVTKNFA